MPQYRNSVIYIRKENGNGTIKQRERVIQIKLARYLNSYEETIDFYCDWASGAYLTAGQNRARMSMASRNGWVDIFIAEPRNGYHGLYIELKKEGTRVYLKNGLLSSNPQIIKENDFLERQRAKGYKAGFAIGYEHAKRIIDKYLGKPALFDDDLAF